MFTFESNPPGVASPWLDRGDMSLRESAPAHEDKPGASPELRTDIRRIAKLEAEPQEGPVEYKLHLLLRPRRRLSTSSTVLHVSGSHQSKSQVANTASGSGSSAILPTLPVLPTPTSQSRHNRLQSLTTQLLWRLQQSSPFHSSAKTDLVVPKLTSTENGVSAPDKLGKPLSGLEESQGALYEIGVSDDGALVGLTEDELEESLCTLRIMASSLGCSVDVLRRMSVGTCQWTEEIQASSEVIRNVREEVLWVAEAQVVPNLGNQKKEHLSVMGNLSTKSVLSTPFVNQNSLENECTLYTDQLRVSLTGSTTSGKSSLLGTLSTSTLDNGRGKSRLSLLKHRHEIASGVTSSIVTELIGYYQVDDSSPVNVVNFASGNVSSWNDIHSACELHKLVVLTDSAGHPRYRRTTVRGLLSWAPHWTMCCVAADDGEQDTGKTGATVSSREILGPVGADIDLSKSHLELCLALGLPLIIVVTKLDLASSSGLRETLKKVLTIVKVAGRQPVVMSSSTGGGDAHNLQVISTEDQLEVKDVITKVQRFGPASLVPIILTSAVTGAGVCKLHALLHQLPVQSVRDETKPHTAGTQITSTPETVFHVDEVFTSSRPNSVALLDGSRIVDGHILSGHLVSGTLHVGETMLVGPFTGEPCTGSLQDPKVHLARSCPTFKETRLLSSRSNDTHRSSSSTYAIHGLPAMEASAENQVWRRVRIVSLRNLRLPVRQLLAGQVGTVGVANNDGLDLGSRAYDIQTPPGGRLRKGMVLLTGSEAFWKDPPGPYRRFSAVFEDGRVASMMPGSSVIVYIASIRASAKILTVQEGLKPSSADEIFPLDNHHDDSYPDQEIRVGNIQVSFGFLASIEWFEPESRVLVMPERAEAGSVGLEGFVGTIIHK